MKQQDKQAIRNNKTNKLYAITRQTRIVNVNITSTVYIILLNKYTFKPRNTTGNRVWEEIIIIGVLLETPVNVSLETFR